MNDIDINSGRIFYGKCYYDVQDNDMVHKSGCSHAFGEQIDVPHDEIIMVKKELDEFTFECDRANKYLLKIMNLVQVMKFSNLFQHILEYVEFIDISEYKRYWRLLELPCSFRNDFNLVLSLNNYKVMLCTKKYTKKIIENDYYVFKYYNL